MTREHDDDSLGDLIPFPDTPPDHDEDPPGPDDDAPAASEHSGDSDGASGPRDGRAEGLKGGAGPERKRSAVRKAGFLAVGAAASAIVLGGGAYTMLKPFLSPADFKGPGTDAVTVKINPGASAGDIGTLLAKAGVVASARSFVNVTEDRAVADRLRPGSYRLRKGMAAGMALDLLLSPSSRIVKRVTVPEGLRLGETLERLAKQTGLPLKGLQAVGKGLEGLPKYAHGLEGFLFPATYEVEPGEKPAELLAAMVERFDAAATEVGLVKRAAEVHLTPLEVVTVASIVQAEGGRDEDYPKIARVIYNRLSAQPPRKLEIDSTVMYAQGRRGTLKLSNKDTRFRSPYNTYLHRGLPPGPISNPGEKALLAALHPAKGDWTWFVTTDPAHRITKFTNKESDFVRYREELNANLGKH